MKSIGIYLPVAAFALNADPLMTWTLSILFSCNHPFAGSLLPKFALSHCFVRATCMALSYLSMRPRYSWTNFCRRAARVVRRRDKTTLFLQTKVVTHLCLTVAKFKRTVCFQAFCPHIVWHNNMALAGWVIPWVACNLLQHMIPLGDSCANNLLVIRLPSWTSRR